MIARVFRSIVVGTDGSETAGKAVGAAVELAAAERRDARARLRLRAGLEPAAAREARQVPARHAVDDQPPRRRRRDAPPRRRAGDGGRRDRADLRPRGRPADAILDVAEELGADLIVVGNKGMTGAKRFLLGSVPNKVSHHAPCAVMIIRTT